MQTLYGGRQVKADGRTGSRSLPVPLSRRLKGGHMLAIDAVNNRIRAVARASLPTLHPPSCVTALGEIPSRRLPGNVIPPSSDRNSRLHLPLPHGATQFPLLVLCCHRNYARRRPAARRNN